MLEAKINIAIDGYSGCGKSTLAKALADALGYVYIDSGAMYRAVTYYMIDTGVDPSDLSQVLKSLDEIDLNFVKKGNANMLILNGRVLEDELRTMEVNELVSHFSVISEVRSQLVKIQKSLAEKKGFVMDGRDIGTVVLKDAELKLFIICDMEIRVSRRKKELDDKNIFATFESVRKNFIERDRIDSTRADSPLRQAPDALLIDNSHLTSESLLQLALDLAADRI